MASILRRRSAAAPVDPDLPAPDSVAIAGYDALEGRDIARRLPQLSQEEMEAVETYERAHRGRPVVLDKLRYLRSAEPVAGYDALPADQVPAALADASLDTINRAREYERRMRRRAPVLLEIERLGHSIRHPGAAPGER
jgi:hypothetical protein